MWLEYSCCCSFYARCEVGRVAESLLEEFYLELAGKFSVDVLDIGLDFLAKSLVLVDGTDSSTGLDDWCFGKTFYVSCVFS